VNISILGSTGSIGTQTIDVAENLPNFRITALTAHRNHELLAQQARRLKPQLLAMYDKTAAHKLKAALSDLAKSHKFEIVAGMDGLLQAATLADCDIVVNALVGSIGLRPTLAAISAKKQIALANKETLVAGGSLVMAAARKNGVTIRPIDSEHSAIWQCLQGADLLDKSQKSPNSSIKRIILTASGGPFRTWTHEQISQATVQDTLKHPNWDMGAKITVDSATMMNKGLERIEAQFLFGLPTEKVDIIVHPQSVVHSMVEFADGAILAQMAAPDMMQPIQYALTMPSRPPRQHTPLDFSQMQLTFEPPDFEKFPCLQIAEQAAKLSQTTLPAMMNALNEILVAAFLRGEIGFYDISGHLRRAVAGYRYEEVAGLADIDAAERWAAEFWGGRSSKTNNLQ